MHVRSLLCFLVWSSMACGNPKPAGNAKGGTPAPADASLRPTGSGWHCFDVWYGETENSFCHRTADRCQESQKHAADDVEKNNIQAIKQKGSLTKPPSACAPQPKAECYTTTDADGKLRDFSCRRTQAHCDWGRGASASETVSRCATWD